MSETLSPWSPQVCALPVPHEQSPSATARRGTRRIPQAVRRLVGRQLSRERAIALVSTGEFEEAPARVVWKVGDSAVVQPLHEFAVPVPAHLVAPVRRIGTYKGSPSRIAMLPVVRDGRALMLTLDSGLELAWAQSLDMNPLVSSLYAQPFMLIWSHAEGSIVHVPDLAAVVDGQLTVFEVKPASRLAAPWIEARTLLAQRSLARSGASYRLLSDVTRQRSMNLRLLSGYRRFNPFLADEIQIALQAGAHSIGGIVDAVCRARQRVTTPLRVSGAAAGMRGTGRLGEDGTRDIHQFDSVRVGLEVAMHLLATGHFHTDLDQPLRLSSVLMAYHSRGTGRDR